MTQLSAKGLLNTASERTGLSDFGGNDILEGYEKLIAGINRADSVKPDRADVLKERIIWHLTNVLYYQEDIKNHPEILEQELLPPLVIASLPRTGTTKLQRLLSSTDAFHNLAYWQIYTSARIPGEPDCGRAMRIAKAQEFCDWQEQASPQIYQAHAQQAETPEEEVFIQDDCFRGNGLAFLQDSPDFREWLATADRAPAYDYLLNQFKYLQWQFYSDDRRPFLIKSPGHLGIEHQLDRIFPQGKKYVFTHRKPTDIIASTCFLNEAFIKLYYQVELDYEAVGAMAVTWLSQMVKANMAWRDQNESTEILDISFNRVNSEGIAVARQVYEFAGVSVNDDFIVQLEQWEKDNPRFKHGKPPAYSLETYGVTEEQINEAFAPYIERFAEFL